VRKSRAKRVVTIIMLITTGIQFAIVQPVFFGVYSYFGFHPPVFLLPMSFICIVFYVLHLYQQWPLMLAWFKKSPDKKKQRAKTWRAVVLMIFILALVCALAFSWSKVLNSLREGQPPPLESMRIFMWIAFVFLAIHVWQRWRLTFSYFRRSPSKKAKVRSRLNS
jgi:protein-S-isoprenylcysteine O-methyltransferase Ste14